MLAQHTRYKSRKASIGRALREEAESFFLLRKAPLAANQNRGWHEESTSTVRYTIHGQTLIIETPHPAKTVKLLYGFAPLRKDGSEGGNPLFRLTGDTPLAVPSYPAENDFNWKEFHYRVYSNAAGILIAIEQGRRCHVMHATHDWKCLHTDLQLTEPHEAVFLHSFLAVALAMASVRLKDNESPRSNIAELLQYHINAS